MSKPLDLDTIKARLAAACPGPWKGFTFRRPIDGNCYVIVREDDPHVIAATLVPQYGDNDTAVMLLHAREDMDALVAEVERLRQTLDATEKECDQWHDAALDRRQALHDAGALRTGVYLALSPEGGVNGWRPSRGVDTLIDLALTVREDAENAEKGAAACDQIVALLDGFPVENPCPEASRVAEILLEVERLRGERAAVVAWLRKIANDTMLDHMTDRQVYARTYSALHRHADRIERGEHRREEEQ